MMLEKIMKNANPYNFSFPVTDENFFFGRDDELSDVIYYLNHAKQTSRPIHLAFIGDRAAGKTSFLNIAGIEAQKRGFCVVRVDLDESDAENQLNFFRKIFDSIALECFELGFFGGKKGKTFDAYLDIISTYETSASSEFLPFIFPLQVAKALCSSNQHFVVADDIFKKDLAVISRQVNRPIIILMDECNVLRANRVLLEKLRNIFMSLNGYMIVMTGTRDLFPVIDEVFSPIMRQFKKIDIGPFKTAKATEDCIIKPLGKIGLSGRDTKILVPSGLRREIHVLSGGRPYEIQLICHILFKRCQQKLAKKFTLELRTIEVIQQEIASGHNIGGRAVIQAAKSMRRKTFQALEAFCQFEEELSFDDCWAVEYLFHGSSRWNREDLKIEFEELRNRGVVKNQTNLVCFAGDEFDRLYIKYIARQKGENIRFTRVPAETVLFIGIQELWINYADALMIEIFRVSDDPLDTGAIAKYFSDAHALEHPIEEDRPSLIMENLFCEILLKGGGYSFVLVSVFVRSRLGSVQSWLIWNGSMDDAKFNKMKGRLEELRRRAQALDWEVLWDCHSVVSPSRPDVLTKLEALNDPQMSTRLANAFYSAMHDEYVESKNPATALVLAETAYAISGTRLDTSANDVGYLYLAMKNYSEARLWLQAAHQYSDEDAGRQITVYNLGVLNALEGKYGDAASYFKEAVSMEDASRDRVAVILKIYLSDNILVGEEVFYPESLQELARNALLLLPETEFTREGQ